MMMLMGWDNVSEVLPKGLLFIAQMKNEHE
jgi:hypothetical protein